MAPRGLAVLALALYSHGGCKASEATGDAAGAVWEPCPSTGRCRCDWVGKHGCGDDDGSVCWKACCGCRESVPEWQAANTTRYWDCCKPSCAWPGKDGGVSTVKTCGADDAVIKNTARSVCGGSGEKGVGAGYTCSSLQPFYDNATNTSFVFAAAALRGLEERDTCCACYEAQVLAQHNAGRVVVQVINTGADVGGNRFNLLIPGGGLGWFDGCTTANPNGPAMFPGSPTAAWGSRFGGLLAAGGTDAKACEALPVTLRPGCEWFYNHLSALDNPQVRFRRIACPAKVVEVSGCARNDDAMLLTTTTSALPATTLLPEAPVAAPVSQPPLWP